MREVNPQVHPRWVRSPNGVIAGVCQGVADALGVEVWLVRMLWVLSLLFAGSGLWLYLMLAVSLPRADRWEKAHQPMFLGVCVKLADRVDLEVGLVRLLALSLALVSLGASLIGYLALYFLWPNDSD